MRWPGGCASGAGPGWPGGSRPRPGPPDTETALRAAGGKQIDVVQILARELGGDDAGLAVPGDVSVELVAGERAFRAASTVAVRGWGRKEPTGAALAREYAEAIRDLAAWSSFRVLGSVRGEPAAVGGCTLRGEVAQEKTALLWGAVTLREYRRRGAYRAVLAERLRLAHAHGATLALVKGRIETSGPILLRAGFARLRRGALLLAPGRVTNAWLCPGGGRVVMHP